LIGDTNKIENVERKIILFPAKTSSPSLVFHMRTSLAFRHLIWTTQMNGNFT